MTTPDLNIVMPYGVTMEGDGTTYAKIPKNHPKRLNPSRFALPNLQPCRVSASWAENPNPVDVNLYNGNRFVRTLATIQAGGGRSWWHSGRGTATSSNCWGTGIHQSPRVRPALSKSTRSTSSNAPRRGGGVGDRSEHRGVRADSLRHIQGRWHCERRGSDRLLLRNEAGVHIRGASKQSDSEAHHGLHLQGDQLEFQGGDRVSRPEKHQARSRRARPAGGQTASADSRERLPGCGRSYRGDAHRQTHRHHVTQGVVA